MASQKELFESITRDTIFDESVYKKIYGCAVTDPKFLDEIAIKLAKLDRKDAIYGYNQWYEEWKKEHDAMMKRVAIWYKEWNDSRRKQRQGASERKCLPKKQQIQRQQQREKNLKDLQKLLGFKPTKTEKH